MLTDKEKLILHFVAILTIVRMTGVKDKEKILNIMLEDIRRERCRSIVPEDMSNILEDVDEEMQSGQIMLKELMAEIHWSKTGERPNKNTNWRDMR